MKKHKIHIIWVIIAVAALVGGIFIGKGMAAANGSNSTIVFNGSSTRGAGGTRFGAGAGGGFAAGQVLSIGGDSLTLQLPNGNSVNVFYSSSTQVVVPQKASIASVTPGTAVIVGGTQNSDGSMTATTIQIRNDKAGN